MSPVVPFRALAGALALTMLTMLTAQPAAASPRDEQERIDRSVAEASATLEHATAQAQEAAAEYAEAEAALPAARARLDEARGAAIAAQTRADTARRAERQAAEELADAQAGYRRASDAVDRARDDAAAFAVAAYKGSRIAGARMMLRARAPQEVADRYGYLDHVSQQEQSAFDVLAGSRLAARQAENEAAVAHDRAEETRAETEEALAAARRAQRDAERAAQEAEDLVAQRKQALADAEAEREETMARYEEAQQAAEEIADEVRQWEQQRAGQQAEAAGDGSSASGSPAGGGQGSGALLRMPAQGWKSSVYGMRHDPVYDVRQLHAGVDIAASAGAPVRAAAGGTVIKASWHGGYGNFTCIGHGTHDGQALSTCYGHQSAILVSAGESVGPGDLIGRIGNTGASTGAHLHFEVRLDGTPTDPEPYLPACFC